MSRAIASVLVLLLCPSLGAHPPYGLVVDGAGRVHLLDWAARRILRIAPDGSYGVLVDFDDLGIAADVHGLALAPDGRLLATETYGRRMWLVDAGGRTTLHPWCLGDDDGHGAVQDAAFGPRGRLHLLRRREHRGEGGGVRGTHYRFQRLEAGGRVTGLGDWTRDERHLYASCFAVAPGGHVCITYRHRVLRLVDGRLLAAAGAERGFADGKGGAARFDSPWGLASRADGTLVVADERNRRIRAVAPDGTTTTLAGTGERGGADGPAGEATFEAPYQVAVGPSGAVYVAEVVRADRRHRIRVIEEGRVRTLARVPIGRRDR